MYVCLFTLFRLTVIAHVGCESIRDTCELVYYNYIIILCVYVSKRFSRLIMCLSQAQHAQQCGASAIGVMSPTFFKPLSIGKQ